MIGKLRYVAPMLGACLLAAPAVAQEQAISADARAVAATAPGLTAAETVWHMRAALNVAALACRGDDGDDTVRLYNMLLRNAATPLAAAAAGTEQVFRTRFAAHWQEAEDGAMTRLYNAFASHGGHALFCATAHDVLREATSVDPLDFARFAAVALLRLEAPFADPQTVAEPVAPPVAPPVELAVAQVTLPMQVAQLGDEVMGGATRAPVEIAYVGPRP